MKKPGTGTARICRAHRAGVDTRLLAALGSFICLTPDKHMLPNREHVLVIYNLVRKPSLSHQQHSGLFTQRQRLGRQPATILCLIRHTLYPPAWCGAVSAANTPRRRGADLCTPGLRCLWAGRRTSFGWWVSLRKGARRASPTLPSSQILGASRPSTLPSHRVHRGPVLKPHTKPVLSWPVFPIMESMIQIHPLAEKLLETSLLTLLVLSIPRTGLLQ